MTTFCSCLKNRYFLIGIVFILISIRGGLITDNIICNLAEIATYLIGLPNPTPEIVKEAKLEATELIGLYGYPAENHTLLTIDGYNLIHHRIPYGKNGKLNKTAIPVLIVHGMNSGSMHWFDNGGESLAFILADDGYDVWIMNTRGTLYSNHTRFTRNDKEFWDYSLEDMSGRDLLPLIDYILKETGFSKLLYVGQSMGTSLSFFLLSEYPEYNKKIAGIIAQGPILQPRYSSFLLKIFLKQPELVQFLRKFLNINSLMSPNPLTDKLKYIFCPSDNPIFCETFMIFMYGFNPDFINKTRIPIYASHNAGMCTKLLVQYGQLRREKFQKFNYGKSENIRRYGSVNPPEYNIKSITAPVILIHSANDVLTTPLDVEYINTQLPNVVEKYLLPYRMFLHTDYMFLKHGKELLYDKIIAYLKQLWEISNPHLKK